MSTKLNILVPVRSVSVNPNGTGAVIIEPTKEMIAIYSKEKYELPKNGVIMLKSPRQVQQLCMSSGVPSIHVLVGIANIVGATKLLVELQLEVRKAGDPYSDERAIKRGDTNVKAGFIDKDHISAIPSRVLVPAQYVERGIENAIASFYGQAAAPVAAAAQPQPAVNNNEHEEEDEDPEMAAFLAEQRAKFEAKKAKNNKGVPEKTV